MRHYLALSFILLIIATSCVKNKKEQAVTNQATTNEKAFEIKEVIQTSGYTYMNVSENSAYRWVAATKMEAKPGEKYYYDGALQMNNFHSKELDRTFETIYFLNKVSSIPFSMQEKINSMGSSHSGNSDSKQKSNVVLRKENGEITIAQVFEKQSELENKEVTIRGIVVKVNKQVMGKNWIHLQDGTDNNGSFDLTITSQDLPEKGDEATFKGTIILKKDFGAGYYYDVIMEDAQMLQTKRAASQL
jgi:hypothetical protein